MKFSTHDSDHDNAYGNCAAGRGGGFWWNKCFLTNIHNINGLYSGGYYNQRQLIQWNEQRLLKKTQLMIRPAAEN